MNSLRNKRYKKYVLTALLSSILCTTFVIYSTSTEDPTKLESQRSDTGSRKINAITVLDNKYVTAEAIISHVPFKVGEQFDPRKKSTLIKNIYDGLKRFKNISVYGENIGDDSLNLYIVVEEKKLLKNVIFEGNKQLSEKEIKEKINFTDVPAIDKGELKKYAQDIKKLYLDKGYHRIDIDTDLDITGDQATAIFKITEHSKSLVKQIHFKGNKNISSKELRGILYTREDWVLSFMDKAGSYHPERLEADKQMIEQHYQNHGYLQAKVADIDIDMNPVNSNIILTFEIQEGDLYTINEIKIPTPEDQVIPEAYLLSQIPIRPGDHYSREAIVEAMKRLELIWGNQGYVFTHIDPSIQPDEETKTVNLAFYTELGNKVFLNKITIKGNKKTRDPIVRRRLLLEEGALLTQSHMDASKSRVEALGYFDQRDGVNWKLIRVGDDQADLDLILKETKTGRFHFKLGFGGAGADLSNPTSGMSVGAELADTNLFGKGILLNLETNLAKEQQSFNFHLAQPWLFDKPISGAMDIYHKRPTYDDFRNASPIHERLTGGAVTSGVYMRNRFMDDTQVLFSLGVDNVRYQNQSLSKEEIRKMRENNTPIELHTTLPFGSPEARAFQTILNKEFSPGTYLWFANNLEQDTRNHPMHPSRGHKWRISNRFAFSVKDSAIGFYKFDLDGTWLTPLIGEYLLVFKLHAHFGFVTPFSNHIVPYGELYNIGGPASIRGWLFGQIGPKLAGDSIGAKKAMFINAELVFPITPDFNMKGVFFYDGGSGWDNPYACCIDVPVNDNNFSYRHAVGFGIRMLNPMPIKVDWGFKLDPRKNRLDPRRSESASEVHFGMTYDW
ncbi:MAG: outer membrane protein assembly factor BamA [Candidatus Dependentiae bacterium]|nr:outer membrane protein assembly factor BamA [Candidatus Dependentiae bacterium]